MAVADEYGTKDIFSSKKQYDRAGYHTLIPSIEIARSQQVSKKTGLRRSFPLIIQSGYIKEAKERTVEELEEMLKEAKKKRAYQTFGDEVDKKEEKDT